MSKAKALLVPKQTLRGNSMSEETMTYAQAIKTIDYLVSDCTDRTWDKDDDINWECMRLGLERLKTYVTLGHAEVTV